MATSTEITLTNLLVRGTLPDALSGQLVGVAPDGLIHSVHLRAGRALLYRCKGLTTLELANSVITFGGSILAIVEGSLAHELSWELDTLRRVDLAGQSRGLTAFPKVDPLTGELHLLTHAAAGAQEHVVVSAGGLTRSSRPVVDATPLLVERADEFVAVGDLLIGFAHRTTDATDLVVDTATVRIPRAIPRGLHSTWIPATYQSTTNQQGEVK